MITGIATAVLILLTGGLAFGVFTFLKRKSGGGVVAQTKDLQAAIAEATGTLNELSRYIQSYASKEIFDILGQNVESTKVDLTRETEKLKETEGKLDSAQKNVEERESRHQEVKTAKEEDEAKVAELLAAFEEKASEAVSLEQKLAMSLKNLDTIMSEISATPEIRAVFQDLSSALTNAGSQLRDVITEFNQVNERLNMLRQQHDDLEEEYTKLVEQQLGE